MAPDGASVLGKRHEGAMYEGVQSFSASRRGRGGGRGELIVDGRNEGSPRSL